MYMSINKKGKLINIQQLAIPISWSFRAKHADQQAYKPLFRCLPACILLLRFGGTGTALSYTGSGSRSFFNPRTSSLKFTWLTSIFGTGDFESDLGLVFGDFLRLLRSGAFRETGSDASLLGDLDLDAKFWLDCGTVAGHSLSPSNACWTCTGSMEKAQQKHIHTHHDAASIQTEQYTN